MKWFWSQKKKGPDRCPAHYTSVDNPLGPLIFSEELERIAWHQSFPQKNRVKEGVTKNSRKSPAPIVVKWIFDLHRAKITMDTHTHMTKCLLNASSRREKKHCRNQSSRLQQKHLKKSRPLKHQLAHFLWHITHYTIPKFNMLHPKINWI